MKFGFSQPIEMRVNELVAGVKSDVAVLIYGPDLEVLRQLSLEIERVLTHIAGRPRHQEPDGRPAADAADQRSAATNWPGTVSRRPTSSMRSPRWAAPRWHGLRGGQATPAAGPPAGAWRNDPEKIGSIRGRGSPGSADRAQEPGRHHLEEGPSEVERENVQRRRSSA